MNDYGDIYVNRKPYSITTKNEVVQVYHHLQRIDPTSRPKLLDIAKEETVSKRSYAHKVLKELKVAGFIEDLELVLKRKTERMKGVSKLGPEESLFLLALRAEDDQRPLYIYAKILEDKLGVKVSHQTVDSFFKKRFDFKGSLRKSSLVPLDKFKPRNGQRYLGFLATLDKLPNHFKFHFIDEKHVVNGDCMIMDRVRADPLIGQIRNICVMGLFREAFNLMFIISPDPNKPQPAYWVCGEENCNASSYVAFLEHLITVGWFERGGVLIRDLATIHNRAEAKIAEDLLQYAQSRLSFRLAF
jgi:hypothetical protein